MHDVGAPQLADEQRPIDQLRCHGTRKLDVEQALKKRRRYRVDWHQPGVNLRISLPRPEQTVRLHGLTAENPQGRGNDRDVQGGPHPAEVCKSHTRPSSKERRNKMHELHRCRPNLDTGFESLLTVEVVISDSFGGEEYITPTIQS